MSSWFRRRRFTYHEGYEDALPSFECDGAIRLKGYRSRVVEPREAAVAFECPNAISTSMYVHRPELPLDMSLTLSDDSTTTLCELNELPHRTITNVIGDTITPVMRRKKNAHQTRRSYRILPPDESLLVFQQQNDSLTMEAEGTTGTMRKSKLQRRRSSHRDINEIMSPLVITPPLLPRTQSCAACSREKSVLSRLSTDDMAPTTLSANTNEEDPARLSFVSSSTGYSSARSSLRSSDGQDDFSGNRNTSMMSPSSLPSVSSQAREELLEKGNLTHIDRIAIELLDTERSYVHDLHDIIKGYLNFLVDHREALGVTLDDISSLFGCIERIYAFNRFLFGQLDTARLNCIMMCRCFVDNSGRFEDYIAYCTNYHRMITTLAAMQQQPELQMALNQRQSALGHALPLSAYLLKPVQRILKYHLFIENMLKHLPPTASAEEQHVVKRSHEAMTQLAGRINEEKKKAEHVERVAQLQVAIQKWKVDQTSNLSTYGDLLLEASFRQAGSKTTRLLFLFEEMLLIVKQRGSNYVCKDYIMCSNLMLNESIYPEDPLSFQVLSFDNPRAQYIFLAASTEQKRIWMTELKRMMLDHYAIEIPEKTKQLMLSMDSTQRISFGRPEFAEVSVKNHKKIPKYLEKRRKSMDQNAKDSSRTRSLSASRLLSTSKTSLSSDFSHSEAAPSKYKLFGVNDDEPVKCTCREIPGTSRDNMIVLSSKPPVSRTRSASTIDFGNGSSPHHNSSESGSTNPIYANTCGFAPLNGSQLSSRSRFNMARSRRRPVKSNNETQLTNFTLDDADIAETFDQLYEELISCSDSQAPELSEASPLRPKETEPVWRPSFEPIVSNHQMRSKSLTRLNDCTAVPEAVIRLSDIPKAELRPVERRFSKLDQLKRARARKYALNGDIEIDHIQSVSARSSLVERDADEPTLPPRPLRRTSAMDSNCTSTSTNAFAARPPAARQRAPLSFEQVAEFTSDKNEPVGAGGGFVKNLIRSMEQSTS